MKQVSLKEICYYLFWGLLLAAKGMGLYDGQPVFKVILVAALFFWAVKMIMTSYTVKEILVIGILLVLGFLSYYFSEDKAALIAVMTVVGLKDIPIKRLFRVSLVVWTVSFFGTVTAVLLGVRETVSLVHYKGGLGFIIRNPLGMTHPNVLHVSYIVFTALTFLSFDFKGKKLVKALLLSFLGNLFIFMYSLSYTGLLCFLVYMILILYLHFRKERTKAEDIMIQCLMPVCVLFSIFGPLALKGKLFDLVDKVVHSRFSLSNHFLTTQYPGWFGTKVNVEGNYTIDCSYVHCLYYYGIILLAFIVVGLYFLIRYLLKEERTQELAMTLALLIMGFTEPFLFNFSGKNLIFILLGEIFYLWLAAESNVGWLEKKIRICKKDFVCQWKTSQRLERFLHSWKEMAQKYKRQLLAGMMTGVLAGVLLGSVFIHAEPYVVVNKSTSDRVGKKGDYKIYSELPEEIRNNSLTLNVNAEDDKVFVLSGSITEYEEMREKVTLCVYGGILGVGMVGLILMVLRKREKV